MTPAIEPRFELAEETDIILLTAIMVHSFDYYAHRYRGTPAKHPLGYSSGDWLREWLPTGTVFKILTNHTFTGGFIISLNLPKPYWNYLAPIFINLPYQNQTIGSSTLQCIERTFPAYRWQAMPPRLGHSNLPHLRKTRLQQAQRNLRRPNQITRFCLRKNHAIIKTLLNTNKRSIFDNYHVPNRRMIQTIERVTDSSPAVRFYTHSLGMLTNRLDNLGCHLDGNVVTYPLNNQQQQRVTRISKGVS
ncbi:MAG: hypothetical protein Q6361_03435 [Candidatus Hermodarchaeota archaeon]|nr:hypothetical protein [Candidatus Hermodarchaeota archaeon]